MSYTTLAARIAAALATVFFILWNAGATAWFGVSYQTEQYLALILGLNLCALFFAAHDCLPTANRTSLVWREHFLLQALCDTPPMPARIDHLAGQSKPVPTVCGR